MLSPELYQGQFSWCSVFSFFCWIWAAIWLAAFSSFICEFPVHFFAKSIVFYHSCLLGTIDDIISWTPDFFFFFWLSWEMLLNNYLGLAKPVEFMTILYKYQFLQNLLQIFFNFPLPIHPACNVLLLYCSSVLSTSFFKFLLNSGPLLLSN